MRLTLPEPKIRLYHDTLKDHDKLERSQLSKDLTKLVNRVEDPLVIALDGGWGSGKSLFLKCWVGEHLKSEDTPADQFTLYFDAFAEDYLDDPLSALTAAFAERSDQLTPGEAKLNRLKEAAFRVLPIVVRMGLAASTAVASEVAGAAVRGMIESGKKDVEKAAADYWSEEASRRKAVGDFRDTLIELTEPDEDGSPSKKLIIVVDELDRCRPDFALELLEITKHLFSVPGVHFILGVNMSELANSVRARYGSGIDAERYLHKFVQVRIPMKPLKSARGEAGEATFYAKIVMDHLRITAEIRSYVEKYLSMVNYHFDLSLRDVQRIATVVAVCPQGSLRNGEHMHIFAGLAIISVLRPKWIDEARLGQLSIEQVLRMFKLSENKNGSPFFADAFEVWHACLVKPRVAVQTTLDVTSGFASKFQPHFIPNVLAETIDRFQLPNY